MKKTNLNCGSCLYLNHERLYERRCSELGKLVSAKSCNGYKPDPYLLLGDEGGINRLGLISQAISGLSLPAIQSLASLLHAEKMTRKHGWQFYQKVYVRYTGTANDNYFSNFAVGHVVYADKEQVRIIGNSGRMMITAMNDKSSLTVYSMERFKPISAEMTRKRHFSAPETPRITHAVIKQLDEVLDSDTPLNRKLIKSKTKMDDLVSIISKLSQGFDIKPKRTKKKTHTTGTGSTELVMDWNS